MTEYKLVPLEPTAKMVEAAEDAYMPFGDMDIALRMAILAAPAVQDKPVAWPLASKEDAGMGWAIDYRFLEQVEKVASLRTDFTTSMEAAEQVLIAAAELLAAHHKQGGEV